MNSERVEELEDQAWVTGSVTYTALICQSTVRVGRAGHRRQESGEQ